MTNKKLWFNLIHSFFYRNLPIIEQIIFNQDNYVLNVIKVSTALLSIIVCNSLKSSCTKLVGKQKLYAFIKLINVQNDVKALAKTFLCQP